MSKRLKKAVALMASVGLWLVSAFPERGLVLVSSALDAATKYPIRALIALIATALAVYALWDWLLDILGIRTKKRLENDIRGWLDSFSFSVRREKPNPETYFNFSVTPNDIPPFTIARTKQLDQYVMIGSRIGLSDEDKQIVDQMSADEQKLFRANLGILLTRNRATFKLNLAENDLIIQNRVPITTDLSEHMFMTAVDELIIARAAAMNGLVLLMAGARSNKVAKPKDPDIHEPPKELEH